MGYYTLAMREIRPRKHSACCRVPEKKIGHGATRRHMYDPGTSGPIPLGYLPDVRFVFFEQTRHLLVVETSNRLIATGTLLNLAPEEFWMENFGTPKGIDSKSAGVALMTLGRERGGFDESRVRGRGVHMENAEVVRNFGGGSTQCSLCLCVSYPPEY